METWLPIAIVRYFTADMHCPAIGHFGRYTALRSTELYVEPLPFRLDQSIGDCFFNGAHQVPCRSCAT